MLFFEVQRLLLRVSRHEAHLEQLLRPRAVVRRTLHASADQLALVISGRVGDRRRRVGGTYVPHGEHGVVVKLAVAPRPLRRGELDERAAQAPDVRLPAVPTLPLDDLWRHPGDGPQHGVRHRHLVPLGAAEVREPHAEAEVHEHVRALDVAVHDRRRARVEVVEPFQRAPRGHLHQRPPQGPELAQDRGHGAARDVLQEDADVAVVVLVPQVADHVLMADVLANLQLVHEAFPVAVVLLAAHVERHLLDDEDLARLAVQSLVDASVRPAPDHLALDVRECALGDVEGRDEAGARGRAPAAAGAGLPRGRRRPRLGAPRRADGVDV
mmetsp:Transcript_87931/g.232730  ORF Transcript_87931/g.232730 Transcript_87931/m.232730 type:complete len:326 (+) Transcript_87931:24-1001(+)